MCLRGASDGAARFRREFGNFLGRSGTREVDVTIMPLHSSTKSLVLRSAQLAALLGSLRAQEPVRPSPSSQETSSQEPAATARRDALERAMVEVERNANGTPASPALGAQAGPLRLLDLSLDIMGGAGASSARDAELADLKGGGHDPKKRGFTLQQAELSLAGAVDPWFQARANIVTLLDAASGESVVELEEAYVTTQQLPFGLQGKFGTYLTEFGRLNSTHPHAWDWQDQPVMLTRLFGADGMRGPGARISWLLPTDTFTELTFGVQNANGETMTSFLGNEALYEERALGGRFYTPREVRSGGDLVYSMRATTAFDVTDTHSTAFGVSAALGPNATGDGASTAIYGVDAVWKWKAPDAEQGYPFWKLQAEVLARDFQAKAQVDDADPFAPVTLPGETLHDYGGYVQGLYGFAVGWAAGVRVDWASGSGASYDATQQSFGRAADPYRANRLRISPMLAWKPSEFSRVRLQYDYDDSDHLQDPAHSLWLGFEVLLGAHPPHAY
jgi:hypothetical protein